MRVIRTAQNDDWRDHNACRDGNPADFETPFGSGADIVPALNATLLCRTTCTVGRECEQLRQSLDNGGAGMIWNGHAYDTSGKRVAECTTCSAPILPVRSGAARTQCDPCAKKARAAARMAKELAKAAAA